tara:strand:+ start:184 stop:465 length:282 start_codon:yes stop_codon:yes gene_type:complete
MTYNHMNDLHTDNSTYIDTPFTLELKRVIAHLEETLQLREITITRLKAEVNTLKEREDSQARQRAYNTWSKSPQSEPSYALRPTREDLYDCNP